MVLDFIEEFRSSIVDRVCIAAFSRGFQVMHEEDMLTLETRREIARRVNERLDAIGKYDGKKHKLGNIILAQARKLASFLRRDGEYTPFIAGW